MKANELMIGDWVVYDGDVEYTNPIKVEGMDIATGALVTSDREDVGIDNIQPIPLTEAILHNNNLLNFDFAFGWAVKQLDDEWILARQLGDGKYISFMTIRYVHELQHIMRLCGIEKEVRNDC